MKLNAVNSNNYIINTPKYSPDYVRKKTYLMNLDVNFVNNIRMKNKDYKIAANAFVDVIRRYNDHAFAYYYLSEAFNALKEYKKAKSTKKKFYEIMMQNKSWNEYADYFNIS